MNRIWISKWIFVGFLLFSTNLVVAQRYPAKITGSVVDENNNPLPFASIAVPGTSYGTISNEDGNFQIDRRIIKNDTLVIIYMGYQRKFVDVRDIDTPIVVALEKELYDLEEVTIAAADLNFLYRLLQNVSRKYRSHKEQTNSKLYFNIYSHSNSPLEIFEAFYTAKQSPFSTLESLELKNGRAGLLKTDDKFFVSLSTTDIISDFSPFKNNLNQKLPICPTNLGMLTLKSIYDLRLVRIIERDSERIAEIDFSPKLNSRLYFEGKIFIEIENLEIIKYELNLKNSINQFFTSIEAYSTIDSINIYLTYNYLPESMLVQSIVFSYDFNLSSFPEQKIKTNALFAFYDYDDPFLEAISKTDALSFDYQRILSIPYEKQFWEENYFLPETKTGKDYTEFFKQQGLLINHDSITSLSNYVRSPLIRWDKNFRLKLSQINDEIPFREYRGMDPYSRSFLKAKELKINCSIFFDSFKSGESLIFISQTHFNSATSFIVASSRNGYTLAYANMMFDLFEIHRNRLMSELSGRNVTSLSEAKALYETQIEQLKENIYQLKSQTNEGKRKKGLRKWNDKLYKITRIDNLSFENEETFTVFPDS
jgi:hypothetical protein